ncbi:MAG: hypothetical protein QF460_02395 [Candidatus Nanoarchaeia archaeon]|jgi:hypothetical protein|nr:hypothetical protein [Candidatus Nanoarchaeia archaeon]|tara:strand:+ start:907 stop:1554 length:648 start_codon:yes stop_codon:yes gene_type:complete
MAETPLLVKGIELLRDLGFYDVIIPGALIIAATYAVLTKLNFFTDNNSINMVISVATGLIIISFSPAVKLISLFLVYSLMLFSSVMFLMLIFAFMGVKEADFAKAAKDSTVHTAIIVGLVIIGIIVMAQSLPAFGSAQTTEGTEFGFEPIGGETTTDSGDLREGDLLLSEGLTGSKTTTEAGIEVIFNPAVLSVIIMFLIFAGASIMISRGKKIS